MSWHVKLDTDSSTKPISVAEAKTHLNILHSEDDTYIGVLIDTARRIVEKYTGRSTVTQTYKLYLDDFPDSSDTPIYLPYGAPLQSVTAIKYYDTDDTQQTWSSDDYQVDIYFEPGRIVPVQGETYPETYTDKLSAVEIEYDTGYGDNASDVPDEVKRPMYYLIGNMYAHRESVSDVPTSAVDFTFRSLCNLICVGWLW